MIYANETIEHFFTTVEPSFPSDTLDEAVDDRNFCSNKTATHYFTSEITNITQTFTPLGIHTLQITNKVPLNYKSIPT